MTAAPTDRPIRALTAGMRRMLLVASGLVFTIGIPLYLLPERTERFFAWTINPPLTAAFLGGAYWASFLLEFLASRERRWADARVAVPAVFAFTLLTLVVTLLHIDRFHLARSLPPETRLVTQVWVIVYAVVPPLLLGLWLIQNSRPGGDSPPCAPLPRWLLVVLAGQATVLILLGAALLLAPLRVAGLWPWPLTALTGRAVGVWLVGVGIAAGHVAWEGDWRRGRASWAAFAALGALELLALARFPGAVRWGSPAAWCYVAFLAGFLAIGLAGLVRVGRAAR